jgi:hypothetical protein
VVLAAGVGSRYGGLKQFDAVGPCGETLIEYSVFDAKRAGFGRVVLVIGADLDGRIRSEMHRRFHGHVELEFVVQDLHDLPPGFHVPSGRVRPWGTLHAVLAARHTLTTPFAVINGDDFYGAQAFERAAEFFAYPDTASSKVHHYCMVAYPLDQTLSSHGGVNRGICRSRGGFLAGVEECLAVAANNDGTCHGIGVNGRRVNLPGQALTSMNFWGFTPAIFGQLQTHFGQFLHEKGTTPDAECYIPTGVNQLVRSGLVDCRILHTRDRWLGMTYAHDRESVRQTLAALVRGGHYPDPLWPPSVGERPQWQE